MQCAWCNFTHATFPSTGCHCKLTHGTCWPSRDYYPVRHLSLCLYVNICNKQKPIELPTSYCRSHARSMKFPRQTEACNTTKCLSICVHYQVTDKVYLHVDLAVRYHTTLHWSSQTRPLFNMFTITHWNCALSACAVLVSVNMHASTCNQLSNLIYNFF